MGGGGRLGGWMDVKYCCTEQKGWIAEFAPSKSSGEKNQSKGWVVKFTPQKQKERVVD